MIGEQGEQLGIVSSREAIAIAERVAEDTLIEGCTCELKKASERPSMPLTDMNVTLLNKMNRIYEECGLPQLAYASSAGGSDAAGVPAVLEPEPPQAARLSSRAMISSREVSFFMGVSS